MGIETQSASPEPAVFRTAIGWPIVVVWAAFFLNLVVIAQFATGGVSVALPWLFAAGVIIIVYSMLSTKYRVVDGVLHMLQGPFSRRIELESILRIRLKGGTFRDTTYGLGTRRIAIYYKLGGHKDCKVCVTPKNVDGFMAAIDFRFAGSGDAEAPAGPPGS